MRVSWPLWGNRKQEQLSQLLPRPGPLWLATALLALLLFALRRLIHPGLTPPVSSNTAHSAQSNAALGSPPAEPRRSGDRIALLLATLSTIAALVGATAALITAIEPTSRGTTDPAAHPQCQRQEITRFQTRPTPRPNHRDKRNRPRLPAVGPNAAIYHRPKPRLSPGVSVGSRCSGRAGRRRPRGW